MRMFVLGMKVLIDGNVPLSAGLSSSSALVVCSALTTAIINGIHIDKVDFYQELSWNLMDDLFFRVIWQNSVLNVKNILVLKEVNPLREFLP